MNQWRKLAFLSAALIATAMLWGCGSSGSGGSDVAPTPTADNVQALGVANCQSCHDDLFDEWLAGGGHSNPERDPGLNDSDYSASVCAVCHDPNSNGSELFTSLGETDRPIVGCEGCHGGGSAHRGIGPLPYANPDYERCGTCHTALSQNHVENHPLGDNILASYKKSAHLTSVETAHLDPNDARARCSMCHTDEGFRAYADDASHQGYTDLRTFFDTVPNLSGVSAVQCRTCHDPHNGGELRAQETTVDVDHDNDAGTQDEAVVAYSQGYNLCTSCHQVFVDETWDPVTGAFSYTLDPTVYGAANRATETEYHNPAANSHADDAGAIISDTHFAGTDAQDNDVTGYNINAADENACLNCHDAHGATKFEQSFAAGITEEWGNTEGFHGDYTARSFSYPQDAECALCHSGTEFVKFTEGQDRDGLDENEARVIACVSCHDLQHMTDAGEFEIGETRTIPEFVFPNELAKAEADETYEPVPTDGLGDNALCMTCHSGRTGEASVDAAIAEADADGDGVADDGDFGGYGGFVNVHYKIAGAVQFGTLANGGYEFEGKAYASKFEHVESNDTCLECHSAHDGELYLSDPGHDGLVGCNNCHTAATVEDVRDVRMQGSLADYDGDGNAAEGVYYEIEGLKDQLSAALITAGVGDLGGYPYFDSIATAAQFKAAYNLHFVREDPGAYAHNPAYAIQLLYDSLEALGEDVSALTRDDEGHFDASAEAFRHWDEDGAMEVDCAQCHSSDGAQAFLAKGEVTAEDLAADTDGISASLACETCHNGSFEAPFDGSLRTPGTYTPAYASAALPDSGESNICFTCHSGRTGGNEIKASTDDFTSKRFMNSHYFPAAGTLFNAIGYEYEGADYENVSYFAHDGIGSGGDGPCVGCHMTSAEKHSFDVVAEDASGQITAVTSTVCNDCHDGGHGPEFITVAEGGSAAAVQAAADFLQAEVEEYHASLNALAAQLNAAGFPFQGGYPYFGTFAQRELDWTANGAFDGKGTMGAAFNFNYLHHEPGAYAHNRYYAKRLIYDSIDYLDNATLDESVGTALDALVAAATYDSGTLTQAEVDATKIYLDGDSGTAGVQRP